MQHEDVARVAAAAADRLADESARGTDLRQSDIDISSVNMSSKSLIACAPTESLGWLGVYWSLEGFGPRAATFLGQSYRFARHEAWIQFIRAPLALRGFSALPSALNDYAAQDFEDVFRAPLFPSAAMLYQTASANAGPQLLDRTCASPEAERLIFLHFVNESGLRIRHRCYPSDDKPTYMRD